MGVQLLNNGNVYLPTSRGDNVLYVLDIPDDLVVFNPLSRRNGEKGNYQYADCVCSFDIETTRIKEIEQSIMYVWQFAINDIVVYGRTWQQYKQFLLWLKQRLNGLHLVIYVHNLSYEIQFLSGIYHFNDYEVFCTEPRKVLKATMYKQFEYRCSYRLTNLSLDAMAKRYNTRYLKESGNDFDYSKVRYSDTILTQQELTYCAHDVLAVVESIHKIMEINDDDLYSIPLTSTGFVRRNVKQAMKPYYYEMQEDFPDYRCYQLLKSAFRGGNTHANRYYVGEIVSNVHSVDISSSYPSQQCNKLFPVGKFEIKKDLSIRQLDRRISQGYAAIMRVILQDVALKDRYTPVPYIPVSKCIVLKFNQDNKALQVDNGRVIAASYIEMCLTDIDYGIVINMYNCKVTILEMYTAKYDRLPEPIIQQNLEYYINKTKLKGVVGQELYYLKNKELLNSIYGMSVQDVVKQSIKFADLGYVLDETKSREDIYNAKHKSIFTQYAYGVWTTAHARYSLQCGIDMCGDGLIYVDTDSCKYVGDVDFSAYNNDRISECVGSGAYATDSKGHIHYMGVYEDEGIYKRFVTLGAKKYAYEDIKGNLHITVSGVNKKRGADELASRGGLEAFKPGFVFTQSGKTECVYNDDSKPIIRKIDNRLVPITRNVVIRETTYTLNITDDYATLLSASSQILNKIHQFWLNCQLQ